jgi:hypothetical protein
MLGNIKGCIGPPSIGPSFNPTSNPPRLGPRVSQYSPMSVPVPPLTVLEVGETLKGGDLEWANVGENGEVGDVGYSEIVLSAKEISPFLGISCVGNEKRLQDVLTVLQE